ncbi:[acyl-carrier-protein] S-malonyltransferase [Pedococcus cremeus]|uniref:[acyl-carrier-protein] S-malonyltransferase n=1 Tax=Pedococcus cremeus TaxID=587636 RepID=A0A1H9V5D0_9MICO|nr:ACP S-malonyltransferase [Pedococcus cremeus]SES16759.1 [acyl-carrier-protein] S-malonyltransferase [Pedococcus cremeus]
MLAIICPGQGSQTPGFLTPWLEIPAVRARLEALSEVAGLDLVAHGTTSDAETIKDTAVAQPLIVAAGLASVPALFPDTDPTSLVGVTAGHSVGEITAAAFAGVLADADAMAFVRERGRGMAAASAVTPTGMSAVLGGDPDEVAATLERHGLTAANANGAGQVVAAGTLEQLAALTADPPARARVIPLQVAGAFHTTHMAPAVEALGRQAEGFTTSAPTVAVVSNADGAVVRDGAEVLSRLVTQVSNPVRWDLCMETLADLGVTGLIELPPAGTLVGLAKRGLKGVETLALKTPDDLEAAQRMLHEHGGQTAGSPTAEQEA